MRWVDDFIVDASVDRFADLVTSGVALVLADAKDIPLAFSKWENFGFV